jgi:hypothetical protein
MDTIKKLLGEEKYLEVYQKMTKIDSFMYSYKNKNLPQIVNTLIDNTNSNIGIGIVEQHPLKRSTSFPKSVSHNHRFWDKQDTPIEDKLDALNVSKSEYFLFISDDILVSKDWDLELIKAVDDNTIVSGSGYLLLDIKDKFQLGKKYLPHGMFSESGFINRNFIFGKTETLKRIGFPTYLKYFGEEEILSLEAEKAGIRIISAPTGIYDDLESRTIENLYTPFSKYHNYNLAIEQIKDFSPKFLSMYGIDSTEIKKLPFEENDVSYNSNAMNIDLEDYGGQRFIGNIKIIE